jgi:phosphoribosylformylglycinamidine synthase
VVDVVPSLTPVDVVPGTVVGVAIYPTPMIGMVGILPDGVRPPSGLMHEGDAIVVLGETKDELGGSEYQRTIEGKLEGPLPELDLVKESAIGWVIREMIARGQIFSAQDCAEGGLGIALARCASTATAGPS